MHATFLSPEQVAEIRIGSNLNANIVTSYSQATWPRSRVDKLLRRCMAAWGCGPAVTANRLSIARDEIKAAYDCGADCVLLMRGRNLKRIAIIIRDADLAEQVARSEDLLIDLRGLKQIGRVHDAF